MQLLKYLVLAVAGLMLSPVLKAETDTLTTAFDGHWVINEELSDDSDRQVEKAIKAGGGKVPRGKKTKGRYRGGPVEQQLYDHLSYDEELYFSYQEPEFVLRYSEGYERVFYSDGRSQVVSTSRRSKPLDFSFAGWEAGVLYVESKPLDAGYILEIFTLINDASQLQVQLQLEPASFLAPIRITRVYDRVLP
ncbi:hypothetical protein EYC98_11820 [Halieaceae bacterium IMCC14734]|uniref:Uncharacterized protein n=1 Tax=Candidatus Litorirhabdus singularis TaxID=2518993 RepID=A0ABT3TH04_9GAMM|nr:hypothetical protein [Candidatus Litorirhabdus singularis]MCX2981549.1 hypothetical protein [Candidatus Litorirhabdus singularis]